MEPNMNEGSTNSLNQVTFLSKYLALALFIIFPFLGGWIGYKYAPAKIVEVEKIIVKTAPKEESDASDILIRSSGTSSIFTSFEDIPQLTDAHSEVLAIENGKLSGIFEWGSNLPYFKVKAIEISRTPIDPGCDYGCRPTVITRLDYYTSSPTGYTKFYSEEVESGSIQKITYLPLVVTDGSDKIRFIQSINEGSCCDGGGSISNRLFEVDTRDRRTVVTPI